ncbi:carbohydrate-binding protein [Actinoplanes sp. NPDC049599]|uniref:carbohydrate-binding protein n=1 Tax=Actinoplanes sp. NPDC049599 TaxID=3363903 RepID=UPI0037BCB2BD
MPRHSAPQQPSWLRPRLVVAFVVATAGLVTAVWLPTRNDSADAAERNRSNDSRRDRERVRSLPAFADDFSGQRGSTVDPAKWALRTDRVNDNLQFSESVRNARLDGEGNLVIVLRGEDNNSLSTARLYSKSALRGTTGRVEARIKAPAGEGVQPAFELVDAERPGSGAFNVLAEPVTDGEFHTYAVEWKPGEAVVSVDGAPVKREALEGLDTGRAFRLALTLGVDDNRSRADLPARMAVDSVSFSGADASAEPTAPPATTPPAPAPTTAPTTEPPAEDPPTSEPPTTAPTTAPTTTPPAEPTTPPTTAPPAAKAWAPFTDYVAGQLVTFKGVEYQVLETHTSLPGWEPTALPALFKKI